MCKHNWTDIYSIEYSNGQGKVIRWCDDCGAYRIDLEYDSRPFEVGKVYSPRGENSDAK